jgi:hypothetical protein
VFTGAFIPVVGAFVSGIAAVAVALVTVGPVTALIMLGGVLAVQQLEGHVLQPFLMGRLVRVHRSRSSWSSRSARSSWDLRALIAVPLTAIINTVGLHVRLAQGPGARRRRGAAGPAADPVASA